MIAGFTGAAKQFRMAIFLSAAARSPLRRHHGDCRAVFDIVKYVRGEDGLSVDIRENAYANRLIVVGGDGVVVSDLRRATPRCTINQLLCDPL